MKAPSILITAAALSVACVFPVEAAPAGSEPLTLNEALRLAAEGPAVTAAQSAVDGAAASVSEVKSIRRPQLSLDLRGRALASTPGVILPPGSLGVPVALAFPSGERDIWQTSVELRQLIWDAGRTRALLRAAGQGQQAASAAADAVGRVVELATVQAFASAAEATDLVAVADKAVEEHQAMVRQVQSLVDQEQLPQADLMQAQAALEQARLKAIDARVARRRALAALEELVGRPVEAVTSLPESRGGKGEGEEAWIRRALERRPELAALERQAEALRSRAVASRAETRPALVAIGRAEHVDDSYMLSQDNAAAVLALSFPFYDGGRAKARAARDRAEASRADARREETARRIRREVRNAFAELDAASHRVRTASSAARAAEEALRLARLRYREDLITNRELLDAEAAAVAARQAVAIASTDLARSRFVLRNLAGESLTEQLPPADHASAGPDVSGEDAR